MTHYVPDVLLKGWKHPAVQRLYYAAELADHRLRTEVEDVVLNGGWWRPSLRLPFQDGSSEAARFDGALKQLKVKYPNIAVVSEFWFGFYDPKRVENDRFWFGEAAANWLTYDAAVAASLTLPADQARRWH